MSDLQYRPRFAARLLRQALAVSPVVTVMGARQAGKSTLVRTEPFLADRPYTTLDDLEARELAVESPRDLLAAAPELILDEVQRHPELILEIKRLVDEDRPRRPGRFVLTGSANLLLMKRISESLAGRATYINLWPLTRREATGLGTTGSWCRLIGTPVEDWVDLFEAERVPDEGRPDWRERALAGGYPTPSLDLETPAQRSIWFDGYVRTYLERDLQDLAAIDNLVDFRRLMRLTCLRLGSLLNQTELGREARIPRPTVHRYLNLLETSYQLVRLPAYSVNRGRRLVKSPKVYWGDTGLAAHLGGIAIPAGAHLENLVLTDLLSWRDGQAPRPDLFYWRTTTNLEVDFVIEHRGTLLAVEVKATDRPGHGDTRGLRAFRDEYAGRLAGGLLLYTGNEIRWMAKDILAVPWHRVL